MCIFFQSSFILLKSFIIRKYLTVRCLAWKLGVLLPCLSSSCRNLKWEKRKDWWNAHIRCKSLIINGESIRLRVQLDILLIALPLGAEFLIVWHILRHVLIESLNEQAHALTNHQRVIIGSSSLLNFSSVVSRIYVHNSFSCLLSYQFFMLYAPCSICITFITGLLLLFIPLSPKILVTAFCKQGLYVMEQPSGYKIVIPCHMPFS